MDWRMLQIADSAFPTGGFAHSAGLEAAIQQGHVRGPGDFERFLDASLWQTGHGVLPLVGAAYDEPARLSELDRLNDLFLTNPVANRASRVQGRAFRGACEKSFGVQVDGPFCHYAPVLGAALRLLGIERRAALRLTLYMSSRGLLSSAVRIGTIGSYQAQGIQDRLTPRLDEVLERCENLSPEELAQVAPSLDLFQANHDRLYSRLFQS
jgi:urease accessory protein